MSNKLILTINEWQKLFIELSFDEGRKLIVYKDLVGIPTVGIGFNLKANKTFPIIGRTISKIGERITDKECNQLFQWSVENVALTPIEKYLLDGYNTLSDVRKRALINLCFNMGINTLLDFKNSLYYLFKGEYSQSADNFKQSKWYRQVKSRGDRITDMIRNETISQDYIQFAKNNFPEIIYP